MTTNNEETARGTGARLLHTLLFAFVFSVLCWVLVGTVIAQLATRLLAATPSAGIARFSAGLARYTAQVVAYLCFVTETLPFPFSDWPEVPTRVGPEDLSNF